MEDREHTFLYEDGEGYHFMNPENYDQVAVPKDVIGSAAPYLQEGMKVMLALHNDVPLTVELPAACHPRDHRDRTGDEGADGLVFLQAGDPVERRAHRRPAACWRSAPVWSS